MTVSIKTRAQLAVLSARTAANRTSNSAVEGLNNFFQNRVVAGLQALDAKQDARFDLFIKEADRINEAANNKAVSLQKALNNVGAQRVADIAALRKVAKV